MPARKPRTPRTRDQIVAYDATSDEGKERMIGELGRRGADVETRVGKAESALAGLTVAAKVTGSRGGNAALESLLAALAAAGIIKDGTTP